MTCTTNCPVSLEVNTMAKRGHRKHSDCILWELHRKLCEEGNQVFI